jgi:hypothetical protein
VFNFRQNDCNVPTSIHHNPTNCINVPTIVRSGIVFVWSLFSISSRGIAATLPSPQHIVRHQHCQQQATTSEFQMQIADSRQLFPDESQKCLKTQFPGPWDYKESFMREILQVLLL